VKEIKSRSVGPLVKGVGEQSLRDWDGGTRDNEL